MGERETVKMRKEREFKSTILFYYVNVITKVAHCLLRQQERDAMRGQDGEGGLSVNKNIICCHHRGEKETGSELVDTNGALGCIQTEMTL